MQSTLYEMPGWMKHKLESRLPGEISVTSDMQMTLPFGRKQRRTEDPFGSRVISLRPLMGTGEGSHWPRETAESVFLEQVFDGIG